MRRRTGRTCAAATLAIGMPAAALAVDIPAVEAESPISSAAVRTAADGRASARFDTVANRTDSPVSAEGHERVVASVRVVRRSTGKPVSGRVWFVDLDGFRVSAKVRLSRRGWATVSRDLPPGTHPGSATYRVRYGGNASMRPVTSRSGITFRVSMPPRDDTVDATWAAAPDVTNQDVGDVSGMAGYDPNYGNSWNQTMEDSVNWVYRTIASHDPGALLVTGDLVEGRWGNPSNTSGLFGAPDDPTTMARNQAAFYHAENARRFAAAGLFDRVYPALGDHDIGDNPWGDGTPYTHWKREHIYLWRQAFSQAYLHTLDGAPKYFSHPVGTEWDQTAYATMINPQTLVVTLDVFNRKATTVGVEVVGGQLRWLRDVLAEARRTGVRWIIVQGHAPILPAASFHSSGLHINGGTSSPLWKALVRYHVNLYLAGEMHATSRVSRDGVTQLVTGAPLGTGLTTFATVAEYHDRMTFTLHGWGVPKTADGPLWGGGCAVPVLEADPHAPGCTWSRNAPGNRAFQGTYPAREGTLSIYLNGRASSGSGNLVAYAGS